jgi:hypothetical protein
MDVRLVAGLVLAMSLTGCGSGGADGIAPAGSAPRSGSAHAGRPIDWAHPLVHGVASSRHTARAQGRLAFDPVVPDWPVSESGVEVSDPATADPAHAAVAFVYEFPTGPDFPTDGRISVIQAPTDQTDADLRTMVESNGPGHFRLVTVSGRPAVLIEADGIGRVRLIQSGVVIDITGPAAPPETVVRLAGAFG